MSRKGCFIKNFKFTYLVNSSSTPNLILNKEFWARGVMACLLRKSAGIVCDLIAIFFINSISLYRVLVWTFLNFCIGWWSIKSVKCLPRKLVQKCSIP